MTQQGHRWQFWSLLAGSALLLGIVATNAPDEAYAQEDPPKKAAGKEDPKKQEIRGADGRKLDRRVDGRDVGRDAGDEFPALLGRERGLDCPEVDDDPVRECGEQPGRHQDVRLRETGGGQPPDPGGPEHQPQVLEHRQQRTRQTGRRRAEPEPRVPGQAARQEQEEGRPM